MEAITDPNTADALEALYPRLAAETFTAGWHSRVPAVWPEPRTEFSPRLWSHARGKALLDEAGELVSPQQAERRNLVMFNPTEGNDYFATPTMMAAYQMIKGGEYARNHRHTPNALRVVIDAIDGDVFTVVDGVALPMNRGDILLTPCWAWHSHFNRGTQKALWLDVLDVPLVHRLQPMFFERGDAFEQDIKEQHSNHPFRIETAKVAQQIASTKPGNAWASRRLETPSMKTITLTLHTSGSGGRSGWIQSVENRIYTVLEGSGQSEFVSETSSEVLQWARGDVFVAPMWSRHSHSVTGTSQLLEISDRATYEALGFWREAQPQ
ncbi:cupin domain-containing protein [Piscinibacter koreensis]|uniref:Cupin domain-containing protein n=1 Tax=Piscinibacter koreensis TaxID=2742824 RepID=A0A7Y6TYG2_9BURK|nr:cupin domain-containing protein [Schlegelella koreensis]NUZ08090.1 cupin domain-containing protein [Schlegelella koreensis]